MGDLTGKRLGKYQIEAPLGRGGMAEVYRAYHPTLDRQVAIKVVHSHLAAEEGFLVRFQREARLAASLRHPHIVQVYDFDVEGGLPYMVMEYIAGPTLKERLGELHQCGEFMELEEIERILTAIGSGLEYAHRQGMIHRDIKSTNILFTDAGEQVLADFGIARMVEGTQLTVSGSLTGTPAYMSPEQGRGEPADERSDIYSLGVVLYEMVTGCLPFSADTPTGLIMKHLMDPPPRPSGFRPDLPPAVEQVILKALAKEPERRYQRAGHLAEALREALASGVESLEALPEAPTVVEGAELKARAYPFPPARGLATLGPALLFLLQKGKRQLEVAKRRSGLIASLGAILGSLLALLDWVLTTFDLITADPLVLLVSLIPFLIIPLFLGTLVVASYAVARPAFPKQRLWGALILSLVLMMGIGWTGWMAYEATRPPKRLIVLVADFDGSQASKRVDFGRRIYERIKQEVERLDLEQVEVRRARESYPDSTAARTRGETHKATIVIWGWYDDLGVSPHFELLWTLRRYGAALQRAADIRKFDFYVERGPQEMVYIVAVTLGLTRYAEGDYAAATALFDAALEIAPVESETLAQEVAYFYKASSLYYQGEKLEQVVEALQQAIRFRPDLYEAHHNLAIAYTEYCSPTLLLDEALAEAQIALQLRPDESAPHRLLGDLHSKRQEWEEAAEAYRRALALDPEDAWSHSGLGLAYQKLSQPDLAQAEFGQALLLRHKELADKPADLAAAHESLGDAYFDQEHYTEAASEYQAALQLRPDDAGLYHRLGNTYRWQGKSDEALEAYRKAVELAPNDTSAHFSVALAYAEEGQLEAAVREYKEVLRLQPCNGDAHRLLGGIYVQQGHLDLALAEYERAIQIAPQDAPAHYLLGSLYFQQDRLAEAEKALEVAVTLSPEEPTYRYALGSVYYGQRRYTEAVAEHEAGVHLDPEEAATWAALGDAYDKVGRQEDAISAYRRSIELKPQEPLYHFSLGLLYDSQGRLEEAAGEYETALRLEKSSLVYGQLASVYQRLGKLDEAAHKYQEAIEQKPDDASLHVSLALVYAEQDRVDEAMAEAAQAVALQPEHALAHWVLGAVYGEKGDNERAIAEYELVLRYSDDNPQLKAMAEEQLQKLKRE